MLPGLYDNTELQRREMWLKGLKGKPIFYGWCHRSALQSADAIWEPQTVFGWFPPN